MPRFNLTFLLLLTATTTASAAPEQAVRLSPMVVEARRGEPLTGGTAALATTTPLAPDSDRLSDLFQRVPGLITQDSFGGFDPPRLAVRGSGIQSAPTSRGLVISLFGMPLNAADGSFNLALLESAWLESATLTRGPAAGVPALGGSLALGGAGGLFAPGWQLRSAYGSHASVSLAARGTSLREDFDLTARAAFTATDGWRPHSAQERESILAAARGTLGEDWDLTVQWLAARPWYEVPGPLTQQAALTTPTAPVPAVIRDDPHRETDYSQLSARATRRWGDGLVSFAFGGIHHQDTFYQLQANGISDTDATEAFLAFNADQDWNLAGQHTTFTALVNTGWWDATRYRNDGGRQGELIGEQRLNPLTITAALDHRVSLTDDQELAFGISTLTANRDIDDRLHPGPDPSSVDLSFSGTRFAPRAAWSWTPTPAASLTASYARSYEPPTYNDLIVADGPMNARVLRSNPLDWQRADSLELAAHGRHDRLRWSAAVYYAAWREEFLRLANEDGSSRGTVNADRTVHSGLESAIEWDLLPDADTELTLWATYNYTDARFDGDPVYGDGRLAGVPPHTGAIGLTAVLPGGWFVAPGCQWRAGQTYVDHAHNLDYGGSCLWSLELGRRHPDGWSLSVGIHNVFDSRTIASTAGVLDRAPAPQAAAIFLPAAGRTVELRFEHIW